MPKFQELRENHSRRQNYGNNIRKDKSAKCPGCGRPVAEYNLEMLIDKDVLSVYHLRCGYLVGTINIKGETP